MPLFDIKDTDDFKRFERYNQSVNVPQYLPTVDKPDLSELANYDKYRELMRDIEKADIPEDIKEFLKMSATRHIVFNYARIADYYAHSDKTVQELMEKSALVIIDFNDAIANGYVELNKTLTALREYDEGQNNG